MRVIATFFAIVLLLAALVLGGAVYIAGYSEHAGFPASAGYGPHPVIPAEKHGLLPTIRIARAVGWRAGAAPTPAPGLRVSLYADGLAHPRWLYLLPNGDVLVAETNGPSNPGDAKGITGWVGKAVQDYAGAGPPSPNRITLLRDNGSGKADFRSTFASGLSSPFGMALVGNRFYVADTDAVLAFDYHPGDTHLAGPGTKLLDLPGGPIDHHWTKNLLASPDGHTLYVSVGSNSNVGENGIAAEAGRAAIWQVDLATGRHRIFASGLRNPNGMAFEPETGALWTVVNERDELGSDLVPDYMTAVKDGGFYGWPYSYFGAHVDARVSPQRPDLVAKAIVPDYALGAHTAPLGLVFHKGEGFAPAFAYGAFIGQHGSWNRNPVAGYRVIFVPFSAGRPAGPPKDVLSGFLSADNEAQGRPVGVIFDHSGALLVADDVGNRIWRVTAAN
ncbi:MAG: sorbosone dehydrogenase family protein [Alphaproteobacteria bacterium]|nr:sorbosone dehydrogenase family protein [Alphaproteobacteria bacterium]